VPGFARPHWRRARWAIGIGVLGYIDFFATGAAAAAWAAAQPEITGGMLGQNRAPQAGIGIFGQIPGPPA
jgi:hypothetical protein